LPSLAFQASLSDAITALTRAFLPHRQTAKDQM